MANASLVPTSRPSDLATFTILSDGTALSGQYHVLSVTTYREVNRVPWARLVLLDGDAAKSDFEISNSDDLVPGKQIEILAGYHGDEATIFQGVLTGHAIKVRKDKPSILTIDCRDASVKMTISKRNAFYADATDSEIVEEILQGYGLDAQVASTDQVHAELVQYRASDWDFVISRLDANGHLAFVSDGTFSSAKPNLEGEPALALAFGGAMLEFEAGVDARHQLQTVKSHAWDAANQELIEAEASEPPAAGPGNFSPADLGRVVGPEVSELFHGGRLSVEELQAWADAKLQRSRLAKVRGRVRCQGFRDIAPGDIVELQGVGDRFNGKAFVSAVRHEYQRQVWETDIQFGLNPKWFHEQHQLQEPASNGLLPGLAGLHLGVVRQLQDDPDGEFRVLVSVPAIDPDDEGIWARVVTLDAGENRGSFFRPEIGDEVALGFVNGDPRDPLVLGMLHSSAKPAPLQPADDNHQKGFVTRSEMKILFDDEKKELTVETPAGNQLVLSEDGSSVLLKDQNGSSALLDAAGITLESSGDIQIKASGDVNVEGANITIKANASLKSEGSVAAELTSGGTTVVKGALVQIN